MNKNKFRVLVRTTVLAILPWCGCAQQESDSQHASQTEQQQPTTDLATVWHMSMERYYFDTLLLERAYPYSVQYEPNVYKGYEQPQELVAAIMQTNNQEWLNQLYADPSQVPKVTYHVTELLTSNAFFEQNHFILYYGSSLHAQANPDLSVWVFGVIRDGVDIGSRYILVGLGEGNKYQIMAPSEYPELEPYIDFFTQLRPNALCALTTPAVYRCRYYHDDPDFSSFFKKTCVRDRIFNLDRFLTLLDNGEISEKVLQMCYDTEIKHFDPKVDWVYE